MNEQKQMDWVFYSYMGFLCLCMICVFIAGKIYDHGKAEGHKQGFQDGQVAAMHGQWAYAEQIIVTTNLVQTNYVKVINGIPQAPVLNIKAVQNNMQLPIYQIYTNEGGTGMVYNIK